MMCIFFSTNTIIRYVEKTLSEKKRVRFEKHILKCERCMKKFVDLSELLTAPELMEWKKISRKESRSILSRIEQDRYQNSKYRKFLAELNEYKNKLNEVRNDLIDALRLSFNEPELEFVKYSKRSSERNSSYPEISTNFKINDFETNIYCEKKGDDSFNCQIKVFRNGMFAENLRYILLHESGRTLSYLNEENPNKFKGLFFGRYHIFLKQHTNKIGQKKFSVNKELFLTKG